MLKIRVDDFPGTKEELFYKHNLNSFKKFDEVLRKNGVNEYVLGVIPKYTHILDFNYFKENKHIVVAIHGLNHSERVLDEFSGLSKEDICATMAGVKSFFESILETKIEYYIPPHNVYNEQTTHALNRLGFKYIMTGPGTDFDIKLNGLKSLYSFAPLEYGRSDELLRKGSVEHLLEECKHQDIWLTLHWTWERDIGLKHLDLYLSKLKDIIK